MIMMSVRAIEVRISIPMMLPLPRLPPSLALALLDNGTGNTNLLSLPTLIQRSE